MSVTTNTPIDIFDQVDDQHVSAHNAMLQALRQQSAWLVFLDQTHRQHKELEHWAEHYCWLHGRIDSNERAILHKGGKIFGYKRCVSWTRAAVATVAVMLTGMLSFACFRDSYANDQVAGWKSRGLLIGGLLFGAATVAMTRWWMSEGEDLRARKRILGVISCQLL